LVSHFPDPFFSAIFLILAFIFPLAVHVLWLRSRLSRSFSGPIDFRLHLRGRRILGDNKTWRGLIALPPASAISFSLFAVVRESLPEWLQQGMWNMPPSEYAFVGFLTGLALMLAELPNSFFKRRLNVPPGEAPQRSLLRIACMLLDRFDSVIGGLIVLSLLLPVRLSMWVWTIAFGVILHAAMSVLLYRLRLKSRPL